MMTVTCQKSVLSQRAESDTLGMVVYLCSPAPEDAKAGESDSLGQYMERPQFNKTKPAVLG